MGFFKFLMSTLTYFGSLKKKTKVLLVIILIPILGYAINEDVKIKREKENQIDSLIKEMADSQLEIHEEIGGRYQPDSYFVTRIESSSLGLKNKKVLGKLNCGVDKIQCYELILKNKEEIIKTGSSDKILDFRN